MSRAVHYRFVIALTAACVPALFASQDAAALYREGLRLFAGDNPDGAITALQHSIALQPTNAPAWKALGVVFASTGDYQRAETPFRNACERQPTLQDACLYYGRTLYLLDRFQPAIEALHRALVTRDSAEAHRLLALSFEALGRSTEAGKEFRAAIPLARDSAPDEDPGIDYGVYLFRLGQPEQAIIPLRAALERHPDSARAHLELGCTLLALDRLTEAASHLERSIALTPHSARGHLLLGKTYMRLGKPDAAEPHLRQGLPTVK